MWPGVRALEAVPALAKALDGNANVLPVPADDPVRAELLERTQRAGEPIAADVAIVACTSGSTGTPKGAMLTAANLRASIDATHARLGGPGQWLLATPPVHIAGLQVLLRTLRAGEVPVAMELDDGFRPAALAEAIGAMTGRRRYTSVVPLQLRRILDDADVTAALASLDGVLVGGQATAPELLARARAAGITAVTSYGSSETSGGIAYDGVPLDGARVTVEADGDAGPGSDAHEGRIVIEGPMVARGYRNVDSPDLKPSPCRVPRDRNGGVGGGAGCGVFRTSDAGRIDDRGDHVVVTVLGRMDDVIISGGLKFLPGPIEDALTSLDGVADAAVVGVPDPELGRAAVAAVTLAPDRAEPNATPSADGTPPVNPTDVDATGPTHDRAVSDEFRRRLAPLLGKHQLPRAVFVVKHMPTLPSGKLDRAGLAGTLATRWGMMSE
ncbi:o-succinylbenzoate--CoA ligase [Corynebacterium hansenii]|uniref:O-succinylbenzoate--CoA ligase n=1 Tax=Corynebacterium hansenii TaxID=394964 RepID=A0ABV7ZMA3_9CORY|nr:o-succinylbenzoate--CoA ligase [Corynebacterium hansenii]WJY98953.1 2-succinylbenzoate--CoA ligase [Corynebacterium hansenii]